MNYPMKNMEKETGRTFSNVALIFAFRLYEFESWEFF